MTLSLDDVANKRFRMARKAGYEVSEVDEFVDEVEESFGQLLEENQNLKKQVDSLREEPGGSSEASDQPRPIRESSAPETIVVTTGKEASSAVVRLVELSTEQAEKLVAEATAEANTIRGEANRTAHDVTTDAMTKAERVESEARVSAERLQADAMARVEKLDRETEVRRAELFGALERERDQLSASVSELRSFEQKYRGNLTDHLRSQIQVIEAGGSEPVDVPELAGRPAGAIQAAEGEATAASTEVGVEPEPVSDTPRLDALLGDQH